MPATTAARRARTDGQRLGQWMVESAAAPRQTALTRDAVFGEHVSQHLLTPRRLSSLLGRGRRSAKDWPRRRWTRWESWIGCDARRGQDTCCAHDGWWVVVVVVESKVEKTRGMWRSSRSSGQPFVPFDTQLYEHAVAASEQPGPRKGHPQNYSKRIPDHNLGYTAPIGLER